MSDDIRCFYCDRTGGIVCDSPSCQQHHHELQADLDRIERADLAKAVAAAISQRCKGDSNWCLWRAARWFYTVKCLACVAFGWRKPVGGPSYPRVVHVGQHYFSKVYGGWECSWIEVGHGIWSQWWYAVQSDGEVNL